MSATTVIGSHANGSTAYDFGGLIDDARVYDRALSATEIANLAAGQTAASATVAHHGGRGQRCTDGRHVIDVPVHQRGHHQRQRPAGLELDRDHQRCDAGALRGIAVYEADNSNGQWQYTLDGTNWSGIVGVSASNALLLPSDALTRVRFVPNADFNGVAFPFSYRAWDQTTGTAGGFADASVTGGSSAFSTAASGVSTTVTAVNDEQTLQTNAGLTVAENATGSVISGALLASIDVDNTTAERVYTFTTVPTNGTLSLNGVPLGAGDSATQADIDAGLLRYDHDGSETSADSFDFSLDDGAGTATTGSFNVSITPVNDRDPVIGSNGGGATASLSMAENTSALTPLTTVTATDADLPTATLSYAISGGADAALFTIDANTGVLHFLTAPTAKARPMPTPTASTSSSYRPPTAAAPTRRRSA